MGHVAHSQEGHTTYIAIHLSLDSLYKSLSGAGNQPVKYTVVLSAEVEVMFGT